MEIILKQPDIEKALRLYVNSQGISLWNKTLSIDFNMGRKDNGLSAALTILDVEIPGDMSADPAAQDRPSPVVQAMVDKFANTVAAVPSLELTAAITTDQIVQFPVTEELVAVTTSFSTNGHHTEVAQTAPATMAEVVEAAVDNITPITTAAAAVAEAKAAIATAAVATLETEAAKAVPIAEAKPAVSPLFASAEVVASAEAEVVNAAPVKANTSSLFG